MLFGEPQCVEVGSLELNKTERAEEVLLEPNTGRLWLISEGRQSVSVLDASLAESALKRQAARLEARAVPCELVFSLSPRDAHIGSPSALAVSSAPHRDEEENAICTVLFVPRRPAAEPNDDQQVAIIVTRSGRLIIRALDTPTKPFIEYSLPVGGIHRCLALPCAAGVTGVTVLACTASGADCEVVAVALDVPRDTASVVEAACSPRVRGLFRAAGHVSSLVFDVTEMAALCITRAGAVDVWSWREEADITSLFSPMEYDVVTLGAPVDGAVLMAGGCLWVGTMTGHLVRLPFQRATSMTTASSSSRPMPWEVAAHCGGVGALLLMSLGTRVWSCGADGKVCVWDADSGDLCGSFLFSPDAEDTGAVTVGAPLVITPLWGVQPRSGTLTSFSVLENLVHGAEPHLTTVPTQRAYQIQADESRALYAILRGLASVCAPVAAVGSAQAADEAAPAESGRRSVTAALATVTAALDILEDDLGERVRDLAQVIEDTVTCRDLVRRYETARLRQHMRPTGSSPIGNGLRFSLQQMMADAHRLWGLEDEISRFLQQVGALLSSATPLESLDDVYTALEELPKPAEAATSRAVSLAQEFEDAVDMATPPAVVSAAEVKALQQSLVLERELRASVEQVCADRTEENRELSSRVESLSAQAQRSDEEVDLLKRSLLAARKAAEAQSTEAAKLYGLEARLDACEEHNATLQREVERLRAVEEEARAGVAKMSDMQASLDRFHQKEALAQRIIFDFLHTQDVINKEVQELSKYATSLHDQSHAQSMSSSDSHFDALLRRTLELDDTIDEILHQQKIYVQDVKREFLV